MFGRNKHKQVFQKYNDQRAPAQRDRLCHAPFQNLLFVQCGHMMTCHYNRAYSLGAYPEVTIADAWNGPRIQALRDSVTNYELLPGCRFCGDEIAAGNFLSAGCKKYDYLAGPNQGFPSSMEFQTSNICNLECIMCSGEYSSAIRKHREKGDAYADAYGEKFLDEIQPFLPHLKYASFTGGEPFLNENYYQLWKAIAKLNPDLNITISTNGTILNDRVKEVLSQLKVQLTVSIDSVKKETYERIRCGASFEQTMSNISYFMDFMKAQGRLFSVKFVVMKENVGEIPALFEFFHSRGVQLYPKLAWVPYEQSLRFLDSEVLDTHIKQLSDFNVQGGDAVKDFNGVRYRELINTLTQWRNDRDGFTRVALEAMSTNALKEKLYLLVAHSIENDEMTAASERIALQESSVQSLDALMLTASSEEERRSLLLKILLLPSFVVISELYRNNKEKFVMRFRNQ